MQQTFQCYRCGAQNYIGQPYCWNCQSPFQYNCPSCNSVVNSSFMFCPKCSVSINWPTRPPTVPIHNHQQQNDEKKESKQSDIGLWIDEISGLFNRFLYDFERISDCISKGLDKGINITDQTKREVAASVNLSITDAQAYINTCIGSFFSYVDYALLSLPHIVNDLNQVHAPSKECKMIQRDFKSAIMSFLGYAETIAAGKPAPSRIQLAKGAAFIVFTNEMLKDVLKRYIALGGSVP
jgi:hypothetical protein